MMLQAGTLHVTDAARLSRAASTSRPVAYLGRCSSTRQNIHLSASSAAISHVRTPGCYRNAPSSRGSSVRAAVTEDAAPSTSEQDVDDFWKRFVVAMAKVADDTKCEDIIAYDVQTLVNWTSYMVICTVYSRPQMLAVLAKMEKTAEEEYMIIKQNSLGASPWEVLDFGPVVVHVFTAEQREYYDLESFYGTAEEVELSLAGAPSSDSEAGQKMWTTKA